MKKIFITIAIAIFYNFAYAWNINKDFIADNYGNNILKSLSLIPELLKFYLKLGQKILLLL